MSRIGRKRMPALRALVEDGLTLVRRTQPAVQTKRLVVSMKQQLARRCHGFTAWCNIEAQDSCISGMAPSQPLARAVAAG